MSYLVFELVQTELFKGVVTKYCQARVQTMSMSRSCPGHVQVISYPSPSQISRSGPELDNYVESLTCKLMEQAEKLKSQSSKR